MVRYDLYLHCPSGERYAIRKEPEGDVWQATSYVGPKPLDQWRRAAHEGLEWKTERLDWIRAERAAGHFDLSGVARADGRP